MLSPGKLSLLIAGVFTLVYAPAALAEPVARGPKVVSSIDYPGVQHLKYRYGPIMIKPGQNHIRVAHTSLHPKSAGFITRFEPNMVRASDGSVPPSNLLHMHHVAWMINQEPVFLGVEEKTIIQYPKGFGMALQPGDRWRLNFMLHNWVSRPEKVYLTWEVDFVPADSASGSRIKPLRVHWLDVAGIKTYPVFDALRGKGRDGRFVFPRHAGRDQQSKVGPAATWLIEKPITLVHAMSHLHPGGLFNDLVVTRNGKSRRIFRSYARYYQAAGPVSWNSSISASTPDWRVKLRPGDLLSLQASYDTRKASWYEVMGIMPLAFYEGRGAGGVDAFASPRGLWRRSALTHGELPENHHSGGENTARRDPRTLPDGPWINTPVSIKGFRYQLGDLNSSGSLSQPPVVPAGKPIYFVNLDATRKTPESKSIYHTITSCLEPCTDREGLAFPLADGKSQFDSGQLGYGYSGSGYSLGAEPQSPAADRNTWVSPPALKPGTYTYFCRVHPFMRGAFRVRPPEESGVSTGWPVLPEGRGANG